MKILVTGGLGFIGSNFIRHVLKNDNNIEIINLDNLSYGSNPANLEDMENKSNYKLVRGSILDKSLISNLIKDVEAVINIAAETHVDRSISNPHPFLKTNTLGTFILLEASRNANIDRFLHVSTDEIYGTARGTSSFKETDALNPSNPYSASKAAADMITVAYYKTYGLKTIITRCTNNFGPYQFPEKFIPKTIIRAQLDLEIPIYGSGKQVRDWIYVTDHCEALNLVLRKGSPGEIYNISSGNEVENIKIVTNILRLLNKPEAMIRFVEDRPGHDERYSLNSTKLRMELGWKPKNKFNEDIKKTVEWYTSNKQWWTPLINDRILYKTPWKLSWS